MLDFSKKKPIIFPYKDWEIKSGNTKEIVKRPIALVSVGRKNFQMSALIDTGSDKTVSYLYPFGKNLGVDPSDYEGEPEEIGGLFAKGLAWPRHMDLWLGEHRLNIPVYWLTIPYDFRTCNYNMILGRKIIFDHFDVVFCQKEKKVYFYYKD